MTHSHPLAYRTTIARPIDCRGVGVHSGQETVITFRPAPIGRGLVCLLPEEISLHWRYVSDTKLSTTLCSPKNSKISMVEHLLAACHGLGITDMIIEVSGSEMPIFDGSSAMYIDVLKEAGVKKSRQETSWIVLNKPLHVTREGGSIHMVPGEPTIDVVSHLHEKVQQHFHFHLLEDSFDTQLAQARTFARLADVERLQKQGYIRGGSLSSALVLHEGIPINQGGFRMTQECARHKVLDLMGDLALLGHFLYASVYAVNPSHTLNHQAVLALASRGDCFNIVPFSQLPSLSASKAVLP